MYITFQRVQLLAEREGITIKDLQQLLGFGKTALYKWNSPAIPQVDSLIKIADYFHVSVDYLVGRTDNPSFEDITYKQSTLRIIEELEKMELSNLDEQTIVDHLQIFHQYILDKQSNKE